LVKNSKLDREAVTATLIASVKYPKIDNQQKAATLLKRDGFS
jgi:hypothetical protein